MSSVFWVSFFAGMGAFFVVSGTGHVLVGACTRSSRLVAAGLGWAAAGVFCGFVSFVVWAVTS